MVARILAGALLSIVSSVAWAAFPAYDMIDPQPGAPGAATDVSPNGTVVGNYSGVSGDVAWVWKNGARKDLGPGRPNAVNDAGLVGGSDQNYTTIRFWMPDGTVVDLGKAGTVVAINSSGVALGWYYDGPNPNFGTPSHAFMWQQGQFTQIPDGCSRDLNESGQVLCDGNRLYDTATGQLTDFAGGPNAPYGATAMNDRGHAVSSTRSSMYLYTGVWTEVGAGSGAIELNNNDWMLGDNEGSYGFVMDASGHVMGLSGIPAVQAQGYHDLRGLKINDAGMIVGFASRTDRANGGGGAFILVPRTTSTSGPPPLALNVPKRTDFNGDFRGDLLWRSASGGYGIWLMDGHNYVQAGAIAAPAGATFVLRGDFNGDGRTDLLWKDRAGAYYISLVTGTALSTTQVLAGGSGWIVAGAGDFNGDGKTDLLWWHPTQGYGAWLVNGTTATQYGLVAQPSNARPALIADFNGDGRDDIAWLGDDGHVELYTMNGLTATPAGQVRAAGTGFVPTAVADFNGDGRADIVWAHPDGRQSLWLMDGATTVDSHSLVDAGSPWSVIGAPDLDGDGRADLLWKASDGSYGAWLMAGTSMVAYKLLLGPGTGWSIVQPLDLSSDNKADLVWRDTNGAYGIWLMNGLSATWQGAVLGGGTGWEVVP